MTFDAINLEARAQGGARTTSPATACTRSSCRCPRRRSPGTARKSTPPDDKNAVVGVWASTERRRVSVLARTSDDDGNDYVQVSRLGNPLVNEVIIPLGKKDKFNRTTPDRDAELYGKYVVKPELAGI